MRRLEVGTLRLVARRKRVLSLLARVASLALILVMLSAMDYSAQHNSDELK